MGKFRSKLKGQTKGKRWPKGQSSSSNPETRKYRDQAKSRFFQHNIGPSNLTFDALRKHDANERRYTPKNVEMDVEDAESSTGSHSTYETMQSFASTWSDCSNMSYSHFMKVFRADSALHKEMLAILAAVTDVIKQNGGSETATEYYCSLITTLETIYNADEKNEDQITAVLALLNMGIKTVPEPVLRKHFTDITLKMLHILNDYSSGENNVIIKSIFGVLSVLLRTQELAVWSHNTTTQIFKAILNPFCIHTKPKWRKAAQQAAAAIVKANCFVKDSSVNPAADKVAEFCEEILENCLGGSSGTVTVTSVQAGHTTILHTLGLMKDTICNYSKTHIKKCCEIILRLMTLNYPIVTSCGLQVLHALFSSPTAVVPAKLNAQLITALYEYQPAVSDVQPTLAWLLVMQQAHIHLADVDLSLACAALPRIFSTVTNLWLSTKSEIISAATHTLDTILRDAVTPACASKETVGRYKSKLENCINAIHLALGYQFNTVWNQVMHVVSVLFEVTGATCRELLVAMLKSLAELRDSYKFSFNSDLEHAVGAAVRSMGPEAVLNVITLKKDNGELNIDRSWLLPVLKENIKYSTLAYFREGIYPLARYCQQKSQELAQINDGIGAHSSELLYLQLWNLLPCFCNRPTDIKSELKNLAKVMGLAISEKKELRLALMASLRKLIISARESENTDDLAELSRFDKNYLPILFNVYTTKPLGTDEEGQRLAALDTIKMYLTVARPELTKQLFTNALERLNTTTEDPEDAFIKESILDLIRALVPYQSLENITLLYNQCVKSLPEIKNNKEQKKAYRILEEICSSDSCKDFVTKNRKDVQKLLIKSLNSAAVSSKNARLRCLNHLLKAQPSLDHESKLIRSVIPEAIQSCKDCNEKCREMAYTVLNTVGDILMGHNQMQQFVEMVVVGLVGAPQIISCTLLALASVLHNFSGALGQTNIKLILDSVCTLVSSPTREIVASCLSFIKVYITSLPNLMVAASLEPVVKALTSMTEDSQRHFRLKVRDILDRLVRKYGCESITPFIPETNSVMYKRLRNLRKLNARKKRMKDASKEHDDDDRDFDEEFTFKAKPKSVEEILADSDSDLDEDNTMETDQRNAGKSRKQIKSTWIEEDAESIIDFTDPNVVSKITATKPGAPPALQASQTNKGVMEKDRGFKTASDGRLIIQDNGSDDSDREAAVEKKLKLNFESDTSDSDNDNGTQSKAETLQMVNKKRKRSGASVKSGFSSASSKPPPMKYKTGGVGIHRSVKSSAASVKSGYSDMGSEYKSKKAKGDVKRKTSKLDPYAYLPLQRTALNKRNKSKAAGQYKNIVRAAKMGAAKGIRMSKK